MHRTNIRGNLLQPGARTATCLARILLILSILSGVPDSSHVPWQNLSVDWQMSGAVLLAIATMMLGLKAIAVWVGPRCRAATPAGSAAPDQSKISARSLRFLLSPMLAPNSLERAQPLAALPAFLLRCAVTAFQLHGLALSYLSTVGVLLMTTVIACIVILLWLPGGRLMPVPHHHPFAARTLAEFWGRRWNLWMSDWFRFAMFAPLRRRPVLAVWLVFFISGLLHEYVLNLTLWLVTGRKLFGTMMLYFLLQGAGLLAERRLLKNHPRVNRLFTWLIVLGPVPLVFHEAMLRALHLWVE